MGTGSGAYYEVITHYITRYEQGKNLKNSCQFTYQRENRGILREDLIMSFKITVLNKDWL